MVSVSVGGGGGGGGTGMGKKGKIAIEDLPVKSLSFWPEGLDMPPVPQPGFKCKCPRCLKQVVGMPTGSSTTPSSAEGGGDGNNGNLKLRLLHNCEKLYLNSRDKRSYYLKVYSREEFEGNVIIRCEHLKKTKGDSCLIFVDVTGNIILRSEREGMVTTVKSDDMVIGYVRGSPGSLINFRRNFCIINSPNSTSETKLELVAVGCLSSLLFCSLFNAFYLDEFIIIDPEQDDVEVAWIRRGEGKKASPIVEFSHIIADNCNAKALILAASVTLYELFMEHHLGYGIGKTGLSYVLTFIVIATIVGVLFSVYYLKLDVSNLA